MERLAGADAAAPIESEAAAELYRHAGEIADRWVQHLSESVYSQRPDLCGEALRNAAPAMIQGVAEALRRGQADDAEAPWTAAAREHGRLRQTQGVAFGSLVRELQALRRELRRTLGPELGGRPSPELLHLEEDLDSALDTMTEVSSGLYDRQRQQAATEAERRAAELEAVIESAADGVLIYDAQGRIVRTNAEVERVLGYRLTEREQLAQGWLGTRIETVDGRPFPPEEAPLARVRRGERVRGIPAVIRRPLRAPVWITMSTAPILASGGEDLGVVLTAADVSALHELQEETARLLEAARQARGEAEAAQARLQAVIEQMPSGLVIAEAPSGRLVLSNEQMARIWRRPFVPLPGVEQYSIFQGFHADGRPYRPEEWPLARSIRTGETVHAELADFERGDGSRGTLSISSAPVRDRNGHIIAAVAIFDDISERQQAEKRLRESEQRFRKVFEEGPLGMVLVGLDFRLLVANARFAQMLGYGQAELAELTFPEITHPDDVAKVVDLARRLQAGEIGFYSLEKRYITKPGGVLWVCLSVAMIRTEQGEPLYYLSMVEDISERKRVEVERERLREEAERRTAELEALFNASPDLLFVMAADGTILDYHKAAETPIYAPPERFLGHRMQELLPPEVAMAHEEGIRSALAERRLVTFEYPLTVAHRDEQFEARILPVDNDRVLVIARNITDRKRAEAERERLREEAERHAAELESVISSIADGVIVYDTDARIVRMNAEAERQLGYGPAERAMPIAERLAALQTAEGRRLQPEDVPGYRALRGETVRGVTLSVRRPGRDAIWLTSSAAPIRAPSGEILGAVATSTDTTEMRALQEQTAHLLDAERQARERAEAAVRARDEFLSAAAHELKTPITNLRGYAQVTMRRLEREAAPDPERARQALGIIDRQSDKLARLVQQLLDVVAIEAGRLELHRQEADIVLLVSRLVASVQAATQRHAVTLEAPPTLPAFVDSVRIEQVVANLLDNAVRYSSEGTPIQVELSAPRPDRVRLSVRDYGPGIPPERRGQLFSRFFQAHKGRPFAGLGLGLYYSRQTVERHGGQIRAEFPPDGGSLFVVELPATRGIEGTEGSKGTEG
ncbi:MAG: PAS domain S-box protein [Anaerolineae bacterium]